ncbi:hypothetical protein IM792_16570 [Mucilaginibacter sp. JRF]|uniref:hypothetical protein n=1 Tax=Mucilaginibacter sp. JRF TaxID=2780088 RepID=UPI00187E2EB6|nr:hypothetical protein [Mucilaginibacter sp. JRF]MBE9586069.1 hypothetical protein [Mucilaginibacter sp. JRF]
MMVFIIAIIQIIWFLLPFLWLFYRGIGFLPRLIMVVLFHFVSVTILALLQIFKVQMFAYGPLALNIIASISTALLGGILIIALSIIKRAKKVCQ